MRVIQGDLIQLALEGEFDCIIHGCNCFCTMGAGIAKQIKEQLPEAYYADLRTERGGNKLGSVSYCEIFDGNNTLRVVNAYTQYHMGANFNELALSRCMQWIAQNCKNMRIGYPLIGCGIGGGQWQIVEKIIDKELKLMDHTLVEYVPSGVNNAT